MYEKNVFPIFHNCSSTQAAKYCILTFIESVLLACNKCLSNAEFKSCHGNLDESRGDLGCVATSRRTSSVKELNLSYNHKEQLKRSGFQYNIKTRWLQCLITTEGTEQYNQLKKSETTPGFFCVYNCLYSVLQTLDLRFLWLAGSFCAGKNKVTFVTQCSFLN